MSASGPMGSSVELERVEDGRWIAEFPSLPGVLAHGRREQEAHLLFESSRTAWRMGDFDPDHVGLSFVLG